MEKTEIQSAEIESFLSTPEGAADTNNFEKHGGLKQKLEEAMEEWEKLSVELAEIRSNS